MNEVLMESLVEKLTDNEKRVYDYLISNIKNIENLKIKEVSKNTFTSSATVIRTAKKLGLKGYKELIYKLMNKSSILESDIINQKFIMKNKNQIKDLIDVIADKKVLLYAEGLASTITLYIYKKLLLLGRDVELLNLTNCELILNNKNIKMNYDAVIVISRLGKEEISLNIIKYLKKIGCMTILFTANRKSSLYESSDMIFEYKECDDGTYINYYPTLFFGYVILFFEELLKAYFEKKYSFMKKNSK